MKVCTHCLQVKSPDDFGAHPQTRDRLQSWCKQCTARLPRPCRSQYMKEWRAKNIKHVLAFRRRPDQRKKHADNERTKRHANAGARVLHNLRRRVLRALRGNTKTNYTMALTGCSAPDLVNHLEKQFQPGMSWQNYGPIWHVDHVRPCASFDLRDSEQQKQCFHFTNLQPLFAADNLRKGARQ